MLQRSLTVSILDLIFKDQTEDNIILNTVIYYYEIKCFIIWLTFQGGKILKKMKADLFSHAISSLEFTKLESGSDKAKAYNRLFSLGGEFFFKMEDFLVLLSRMENYFKELEEEWIEGVENKNQVLAEGKTNQLHLIELDRRNRIGILNIKDTIESQVDIIGLGILLRVHVFLEEILKNLCVIIKDIYSLKTNYKDMKREKDNSKKSISTFEKCVLYIDGSPLNTKVNIFLYDVLFEWNKIRNILVHDAGKVTQETADFYKEKFGLQTVQGHGQRIVYDGSDMSVKEMEIIEHPLKLKLSMSQIGKYILTIDRFLATLINPDTLASYDESKKIKDLALSHFEDEENLNKVFSSVLNKIKKSENIKELTGGAEVNEEFEEYLLESLKLLIYDMNL